MVAYSASLSPGEGFISIDDNLLKCKLNDGSVM